MEKETQKNNLAISLRWQTRLAWATIIFTLVIMIFLIPAEIILFWRPVVYSLTMMAGVNLLFSFFVRANKFLKTTAWLWPISQICLITLIVYYTGGFASIFSFLYLIPIVTSAILFSLNAGMGAAILSSFSYLGLTILEIYELIPHVSKLGVRILEWQDNIYIAFSVLLNRVLIFLGVAFLSGFLSGRQKKIEQMKSEFVSIASHQLRTPITSIRLFAEILCNDTSGLNVKYKEYLDGIHYSAIRMSQLVDDFLNVSRIEADRLEVRLQLVQFEDFIQGVINEVSFLAEIKKCYVVFEKPKVYLPKILIDPNLTRQVICNLLTNAIRYSPEKRCSVLVKLEQKNDEEYLVSVKDEGIGIPEGAKSRIFEKFFRADNAKKMETEGIGLGLYIAKMIVKILGGKIWFESEENKGSTFYVSLPPHQTPS